MKPGGQTTPAARIEHEIRSLLRLGASRIYSCEIGHARRVACAPPQVLEWETSAAFLSSHCWAA